MGSIRVRISGKPNAVETTLTGLRGVDGVDHVEEVGAEIPHMRDDSSSSGLPDDTGADFHDVEIETVDDDAEGRVRGFLAVGAIESGLVLEWPERF